MKRRNIILTSVVVAIGAVALVVALRGSRKATFEQDFHIEDPSTITRIFLADKQDHEVLLTCVGDSTWMVDNRYEANYPVVRLLLETLRDMRIRQKVNRNAVPTIVKDLAARAIKVEVYQREPLINWFGGGLRLFYRERLTATYYVGREAKDMLGSYMFRQGDKTPYVIHIPGFRGFLTPRFVTDPLKWRSHTIVDLNVGAIERIELEIPSQQEESFAIVRKPDGFDMQLLASGQRVAAFDTARVAQLLASFTWLCFDEFASIVPNSYADSNLTGTPRTILRVTDTAGHRREVDAYVKYINPDDLELMDNPDMYESFDVNRLYAIIDHQDTVLIQYHVFDNILQPASYFLGKEFQPITQ
ncbi:MAG: DUF4340 domain-containing protein [Bacteroidales bacterium]|nr:DUF4340 domain-containing protein [Bacteroidales bacterium]